MWTRGELKQKGMAAFKANYWSCVLVALIISLIAGGGGAGGGRGGSNFGSAIQNIQNQKDGDSVTDIVDGDELDFETDIKDKLDGNDDAKAAIGAAAIIIGLAVFAIILAAIVIGFAISAFLLNPIKVGCNKFFVRNLNEPAQLNHLSSGFDTNYKNVVKVMFFKDLYLLLWALIPIAGIFIAIVKGYEYRMIPYLLADDPNMEKDAAFARTREMMTGEKFNAFVLDLSFLGWHLLSLLTVGILEIFYVAPYVQSTDAALYETLNGGYTVEGPGYGSTEYING
jgi:uncharacterized membrane protein